MLINVLEPIFMKGMYEHSYGSIPGRGVLNGRTYKLNRKKNAKVKFLKISRNKSQSVQRTIEKWIRHGGIHVNYCLQMDIHKFFESISHEILKSKLSKIIKDDRFLNILFTVIDVMDGEKGEPIGFYTSQWLANWYLKDFDHYIKEELGATYYLRYMDDLIIFGSNKRKLAKMRKKIKEYLENILDLKLKDNWQIFQFHYVKQDGDKVIDCGRPLDFVGLKFYRNRTTMRKQILYRTTRKARRIGKKDKENITTHDASQMLSYMGWIRATNSYNMYKERIKPYANIHQLKQKVSAEQRRANKKCKDQIGTEPKVETLKTDRQNLILLQANGTTM